MQAATATTTINVRAPADVRDLIDRAAGLQKKTRTDFMLEASCIAAKQVLLDQVFFHVTEEQMQAFEAVMAEPISHNVAMKKLLTTRSPWEA